MHWLCKIFGHKHRKGLISIEINKLFCYRCHAPTPTKHYAGDPVWKCKLLGHKQRIEPLNDFGTPGIMADFCFPCHATIN